MSKKIIYLLSLLMALSLVFASCKKNSTGPNFTPDEPPKIDNTQNTDVNTGLFNKYDDLTHTEPIRKVEVMRGNGTDYVRNPVIVSMGKGNVFIFGEKRYARPGAGNDVGIDGEGVVDIVYYVSTDSGNKWSKQEYYVNQDGTTTATSDASHGAPVVFKVGDNKIVIAASAGSGIGRTSKPATGGGRPVSRIDYIVGNVSGSSISWGTWTTIALQDGGSLEAKVKEYSVSGKTMDQFATHSARGVVGSDGDTIYLPVTMAYQGTSSDAYELMGYILLTGKGAKNSTITWTAGAGVGYDSNGKFTKYKEARGTAVDTSGTTSVQYIVVPNPSYGHTLIGSGKTDNQPTDTTVTGSEGSAGFLVTTNWYGTARYTLKDDGTIDSSQSSGASKKALLTHVQSQDADMNMYVLNADTLAKEGTKSYFIVAKGKSSSIDILEDGTIITAGEEGLAGENRNYYTVFSRYSQKFIAEQNGIQ